MQMASRSCSGAASTYVFGAPYSSRSCYMTWLQPRLMHSRLCCMQEKQGR